MIDTAARQPLTNGAGMKMCEDYGYIAKRLREIEDEALHRAGADLTTERPAEMNRAVDFDGWFWNLVGSAR